MIKNIVEIRFRNNKRLKWYGEKIVEIIGIAKSSVTRWTGFLIIDHILVTLTRHLFGTSLVRFVDDSLTVK